jgi:hypothetical protein
MRIAASWSGSCTHRIQGCGAINRVRKRLPLIVIPTAPSVPSCSKLSRCGLAKAEHPRAYSALAAWMAELLCRVERSSPVAA